MKIVPVPGKLPLQQLKALVATITESPFSLIARNLMMGTPEKGDKSAIQNK